MYHVMLSDFILKKNTGTVMHAPKKNNRGL